MLFLKIFSPQEPRDPLLPEARGQAANAGVQVSEKKHFLFLNNNICHLKNTDRQRTPRWRRCTT